MTDVDGFLARYKADDNEFWRTDTGDIQNVLDELIERLAACTCPGELTRTLRAQCPVHGPLDQ